MQAGIAICVVLLVRIFFSKMRVPKKYMNLLWCIPYVLMICPWKISSPFSFWRLAENTKMEKIQENVQQAQYSMTQNIDVSGIVYNKTQNTLQTMGEAGNPNNNSLTEQAIQSVENVNSIEFMELLLQVIGIVWLLGVIFLLIYSIASCLILYRKVVCSFCVKENIYYADDIDTPFVLGLIHPKIYLPSTMGRENLCYVLEHERTHIHKGDHIKKIIVFLITVVHWFNPLAWIAFYFYGKDLEMACDEATVAKLGIETKQEYATALLQLASGRRVLLGAPLAFGEGNVKSRIRNIVKYKKVWGIVSVIAIIVVIVLAVGFWTRNDTVTTLSKLKEDHFVGLRGDVRRIQVTIKGEATDFSEAYFTIFRDFLKDTEVKKRPLSISRAEDRVQDIKIQVGDGGTIYLSEDCQEIWCDDGVKPSRSFEIVNSEEFLEFLLRQKGSVVEAQLKEEQEQIIEQTKQEALKEQEKQQEILREQAEKEQQAQEEALREQEEKEKLEQAKQEELQPQAEEAMEREYDIEQFVTFTLPQGTYLGKASTDYFADFYSGSFILGDHEEVAHGEWTPESWYAPGGIGVVSLDKIGVSFEEIMIFKDDKFTDYRWYHNHSSVEVIENLEDCDMQALLCEGLFDKYTSADIGTYAIENNIDIDEALELLDITSEFWYVFFAETDADYAYVAFLNQDYFTKEDMIDLAQSMKFLKK